MLIILALNVGVFAFELSLGSDRQLDRLFSAAGVIPVEYTRGVEVPPPPPLGITWTTLHISSNMLYLFIFGDNVEDRLGHLRFLIFYLICGVAAGLTHIFFNAGSSIPSVGASGAIAGVLAAYLRLFPSAQVRTLLILGPFITIPRIPAGFLILFWFVMQFLSGLLSLGATTEQTGGVATWAHVGGFVAGFILAQVMSPRRQSAYPSC
jgi:membrane associated rhomboid family serine protease